MKKEFIIVLVLGGLIALAVVFFYKSPQLAPSTPFTFPSDQDCGKVGGFSYTFAQVASGSQVNNYYTNTGGLSSTQVNAGIIAQSQLDSLGRYFCSQQNQCQVGERCALKKAIKTTSGINIKCECRK